MIVDKSTVNRGELPLDPLLARYGDYWRLSSTGRGDQALVRTDEAREIRGARGKRSARPEFFTLHRALGLKQKSSYHHGLEKHCTARIIFLEKHFPAILRKNFTVKSKNMRINWCTLHREPTKTVSDELTRPFTSLESGASACFISRTRCTSGAWRSAAPAAPSRTGWTSCMMVARSLMLGLACSRPGGEKLSTLRSGNSGSGIPKFQPARLGNMQKLRSFSPRSPRARGGPRGEVLGARRYYSKRTPLSSPRFRPAAARE